MMSKYYFNCFEKAMWWGKSSAINYYRKFVKESLHEFLRWTREQRGFNELRIFFHQPFDLLFSLEKSSQILKLLSRGYSSYLSETMNEIMSFLAFFLRALLAQLYLTLLNLRNSKRPCLHRLKFHYGINHEIKRKAFFSIILSFIGVLS
jgi:hypothetical protein